MIEFQNVYKSYENGTNALRGVSFTVEDGEFVFIVGPSGSGKSTVMKLITGEIRSSQGSVSVNNYLMTKIRRRKLSKLRRTLGIVFQDFRLLEKKTVYENVAFAMRIVGAGSREIRVRVPEVLGLVGLDGSEYYYPAELSGGEQQRVSIARALVNRPSIIIADEPTGNIDPTRSLEIMNLLEEINNRGTTVLVVTHEKTLVDRMARRVLVINDGIVVRDSVGKYEETHHTAAEILPNADVEPPKPAAPPPKPIPAEVPDNFDLSEPELSAADIDAILTKKSALNVNVPEPDVARYSRDDVRGIVSAMFEDILGDSGTEVRSDDN